MLLEQYGFECHCKGCEDEAKSPQKTSSETGLVCPAEAIPLSARTPPSLTAQRYSLKVCSRVCARVHSSERFVGY